MLTKLALGGATEEETEHKYNDEDGSDERDEVVGVLALLHHLHHVLQSAHFVLQSRDTHSILRLTYQQI